jgi:hypothetical protein
MTQLHTITRLHDYTITRLHDYNYNYTRLQRLQIIKSLYMTHLQLHDYIN